MDIACVKDARTWLALWIAERGRVPAGILAGTTEGLAKSLSIMDAYPSRYTVCQREDLREALAYLRMWPEIDA